MKSRFYLKVLLAVLIILPTMAQAQKKRTSNSKEIGIQLYSVRSLIGSNVNPNAGYTDYSAVLKKLAKMGYTGIEAAGYKDDGTFYNSSPEEFKRNVETAGMQVWSSHVGKALSQEELKSGNFTASLAWWDKCIAAHKAAGMTYIVTPSMDVPKTVKDLKTQCEYLNAIGKKCKEQGIQYGYHNHAFEFQKIEDKVIMMDYMIENTNPEYVFYQMDVYWVVIGKNSPVDYFKKYPGRFKMLHIKDHREIGQSGMVGFDAIFNNTETAGVKHLIVEMEGATTTIEDGLKISVDYLLKAPFVKASYKK
jgi:sugar phosphate isomerase/epimerase